MTKEQMTPEPKYPIGGYAPGNYFCTCCICGDQFQGDKRAVQCEPCAVKEMSGINNWKAIRRIKGLTLRQVEEITGISNAYLSQLENGKIKKPSYDVVMKLRNIYGDPPKYDERVTQLLEAARAIDEGYNPYASPNLGITGKMLTDLSSALKPFEK